MDNYSPKKGLLFMRRTMEDFGGGGDNLQHVFFKVFGRNSDFSGYFCYGQVMLREEENS